MSKVFVLAVDIDGNWMKKEQDGDTVYYFTAEYAKSSRSRCRICSENILKGNIRIGKAIKWGGGTHGFISSWSHLKCARVPEGHMDVFVAAQHVNGFDKLTSTEQKQLEDELKLVGPPQHLQSIDPK